MIRRVCCLLFAIAVGNTLAASVDNYKREADEAVPQEGPTLPPRCAAVSCFLQPVCEPGEILDTPEGECCPRCVRDCTLLQCDIPQCPFGQIAKVLKGNCCPSCVPDCAVVLCALPICKPGEIQVTPEGQCCPQCVPDCSVVQCPVFKCKPGQILVTPKGECCPKCHQDCSEVQCPLLLCAPGFILVTPEGECCSKCQRDCAAVLCFKPECSEGEELYTPEGECCPLCRPAECEIEGQFFSDCASCPRTCDNPSVFCPAVCRRGCDCPPGQVIDTTIDRCVPMERCPQNACPIKGQRFSPCAGCDSTCNQIINGEPRICLAVCRPGCSCPGGQSIDSINGVCVDTDECPNPCALVDCEPNARCKVVLETGEPFCEPSCDIDNGGCTDDQICRQREVQCKTTPCPPVIECLERAEVCFLDPAPGPCEALIPQYFHNATSGQCERFNYGGCQGNDNRFETRIECQKACGVDPCATRNCGPGAACKIFFTGEAFCEPSCKIDNGGCREDQTCELVPVICVRAPCPPRVQCNDPDPCNRCPKGTFCDVSAIPCLVPPCPVNVQCLTQEEVCSLPSETGPCRGFIPRYYHNNVTGRCEEFIYGGCLGNQNNFETKEECERACAVDLCASKECNRGSVCKIFKPTGEAFCEPSCEIDNGGCDEGHICELVDVYCVRAPCPPVALCNVPDPCDRCPKGTFCDVSVFPCLVPPCPENVQCLTQKEVCSLPSETGPCKGFIPRFFRNEVTGQCEQFIYGGCGGNANNFETREECERACDVTNACALVLCAPDTFCRIDESTGEPVCEPRCEGGCPPGQKCVLAPLICLIPPCALRPQCVDDPCATVRCANGFRCKVFQPLLIGDEPRRPEAFCDPDCNLNNGGCRPDQECQLLPTSCAFNTPCPPARVCVDPIEPPNPCPPTCSKEFCKTPGNRRALCSNPGPRELPGCTGPCQVTYCHVCYYSEDVISPAPGNCRECMDVQDYTSDTSCYRRWANCVRKAHFWFYGLPSASDRVEENFKCYSPPCPFKG